MGRREPAGIHLGLHLAINLYITEGVDERHADHYGSIRELREVGGVIIVGGSILGGADETVTHAQTSRRGLVKAKTGTHRRYRCHGGKRNHQLAVFHLHAHFPFMA